MLIKFTKDGAEKLIEEGHQLIAVLLERGWVSDSDKGANDDLEALREKAKSLGVQGYHLIKDTEKLKAKIEAAEKDLTEIDEDE